MSNEKNEPDMLDDVEDLSLDESDDAAGGAGILFIPVTLAVNANPAANINVAPGVNVTPVSNVNLNVAPGVVVNSVYNVAAGANTNVN